MVSNFAITNHKGFQIKFTNGWTVSVQWGPANYCDNYDCQNYDAPRFADHWESTTAEIAAWDADGRWHRFEHDEVKGHCSTDDVLAFMQTIASGGGSPEDRHV